MAQRDAVLVSWVAFNHDPYERKFRSEEYRPNKAGELVPGPTLTFLFDPASTWRGKVGDVVMLARDDDDSQRRVDATLTEIRDKDPEIVCRKLSWSGNDPTDHKGIFEFVREQLPRLRHRYQGRELLFHVSPGTPSMHTIWVLMATTGFVPPPFQILKSLRRDERHERGAVEPIDLDIDTFYKRYRQTQPAETSSSEQALFWDPGLFRSAHLKQLFEQARRVAQLRAPVLILGERGTGKTTLANWMRVNSPFRREALDEDWPAVACGQYSPETMRAELFGYKKGAFTGADKDHDGLLLKANGDTLFLDEVGDLGRHVQRLLIKAIEEHRFLPMGSTERKTSTFRLITATNVPLSELRQRLDPDFFDRIGVLRLRAPALREIPEDLPWLWREVFLKVQREAMVEVSLTDDHHTHIERFLQNHPLPGNLRNLFSLAWRILARWLKEDPTPEMLLSWLPTAIESPVGPSSGDVARDIAARFAGNLPLDDLIPEGGRLETKEIQRAQQVWLAQQIRRVARNRGVPQGDLVDVTPKTLREWRKLKDE